MAMEKVILKNLMFNQEYCRKVLPFIKEEYFSGEDKVLFTQINNFVLKYNQSPTVEALEIEVESLNNITEDEARLCQETMANWDTKEEVNQEWLIDNTEKFCQEKSIYLAMMKSIEIMNDKNGSMHRGAIPQILSEALSVSFDPNIGHDYFENSDQRFEFYHTVEERVPFDLEYFNKITKGGLPKKTLNIVLAGTGVGKSLFMCHCAAAAISAGFNVLYITMEMAEEKIAERIDSNLLNIPILDLESIPKDMYDRKLRTLRNKTNGKLIIKEYPTASASTLHFKNLLNELKLKKGFIPDLIFVDYLNICASSRIKQGANVNSYTYIKSIAEELRGLAVEYKVPLISATQTTRSGYSNSDLELTDTSESFGLPATADFMFALITDETFEKLGQIAVKQLKNRYNDPTQHRKFVIGVDRSKMKLYDVEQSAQGNVSSDEDEVVFDKTSFNTKDKFRKLKV